MTLQILLTIIIMIVVIVLLIIIAINIMIIIRNKLNLTVSTTKYNECVCGRIGQMVSLAVDNF